MATVDWLGFINCRLFDSLAMKWRKQLRGRRMAVKLWDLYYWNKHEYCWKWLMVVFADSAPMAIRFSKQLYPSLDMMKVEKA
jgi:hypothetical protein